MMNYEQHWRINVLTVYNGCRFHPRRIGNTNTYAYTYFTNAYWAFGRGLQPATRRGGGRMRVLFFYARCENRRRPNAIFSHATTRDTNKLIRLYNFRKNRLYAKFFQKLIFKIQQRILFAQTCKMRRQIKFIPNIHFQS